MGGEVRTRWAVGLDRTRRADVVGGHRVTQLRQDTRAADVDDRLGPGRHAVEVRGLADVGRVGIPRERAALGRRQALPRLVAGEHVGVVAGEHVTRDDLTDDGLDVGVGRPDVAQVHGIPKGVGAERIVQDVDVHRARERIRHHQRRRRQVVHLDVGVDPALEVPVAREHRDDGEIGLVHCGADLGDERGPSCRCR